LPVASCDIATFGRTKVLVVERFDRRLARLGTHWLRLPQEDFCQATGTPASKKYEADGGPGMVRIATLLGNSEARDDDIHTFLKAQIVLSARPVIGHGAGLIPPQRVKMAMAWLGDNRHYHADTVLRRHIVATARKCGYGGSADALMDEVIEATPAVIDLVMRTLPRGFPEPLAQSITNGLRQSAQDLLRTA
jgi:serine/threonine-protein kinase HipA